VLRVRDKRNNNKEEGKNKKELKEKEKTNKRRGIYFVVAGDD
jgi:hypothetical protein